MITVLHIAQFNLAGDGESKEVEVDLDEITLTIPLAPKSVIQSVGDITLFGPHPLPEVKGEVVDGKDHLISLTFSEPLNKFQGGNGYTVSVALELVPEVK